MARRSRLRLRLATALALAGALACKPDKPVSPDGKGGDGKGDGSRPMTDIAPVARIAEMLPPGAPLVWEMAGVDRVAEVIDRDGLVRKFEPQYRKLADEMVRETGRDFLDPKTLADMGIDTKGRMGFAVLSMQPMGVAAFATVKDKGRFRAALYEIAKRTGVEIVSTPLGHAEILRTPDKGPAIVIREPFVAFVFAGGGDGKDDPAFALATMDPHMSLAASKGFKKATGGLAPSDAMFFLDGASLSRNVLGAMGGNEPPPVSQNWAREELAKARRDNAPPQRIKELEAQAQSIDEDNARWARRRQGERVAFEQLMSGLSTSVWTGDAKPTSIVGQGTTTFAADSPILLSFENAAGSPPLARALDGQPLLMLNGKANVEQFLKVVDLLAMADGTSWAAMSKEIAEETGIDPDKDLRSLVTGQVGFAIVRDGDSEATEVDAKDIGAALHVEVHDPKGAREVLAKAAKALVGKDGVNVRKAGDGWVADVPKWRKVYIDIQGPHLVIATDPKLVARVAGGKAGTIVKRADKPALAAASLQDSAASVLFDPDMSFLFFGIRKFDIAMSSSVESPEDAKVPKSRTWKAKQREIEAVDKKIAKAQEERSKAEIGAFRSVIRPWGSFGASARREGNAIVVQGGWFVRAESIAVALSNSLDAVRKLDERREDDGTTKLFDERSKLQGQLDEIRRADLEKFRARKAR
jgi:hypothetical protein